MIARNYLCVRSVNQYRLVAYYTLVTGVMDRITTVKTTFSSILVKVVLGRWMEMFCLLSITTK